MIPIIGIVIQCHGWLIPSSDSLGRTSHPQVSDAIAEISTGNSKSAQEKSRGQKARLEDSEKEEKKKRVKIRMISGDHVETARRVALDAGLLTEDAPRDAVLTAAEFREKIGSHKIVVDKET